MSTSRATFNIVHQCFIYEQCKVTENEEGQAMARVVLQGAWSVLSWSINERNEEDEEERSSISKQLGNFLRQIDAGLDNPFVLTAAQSQLIHL